MRKNPTNNSSHSQAQEVFSIQGVGKDEERFLTNQLSEKEKRYMSCKNEELRKDTEKIKKKKNRKDDDVRKHTEEDNGRKKKKELNPAEKRSRSKEDRIEGEGKKRWNVKAESVCLALISDIDL